MMMNFGEALNALKGGNRVARVGWNGKGMWLELQRPDAHSKMTLPYVYLNYPQDAQNTPGARVPWLASQTDMLAEDWTLVLDINRDPLPGWENAPPEEPPPHAAINVDGIIDAAVSRLLALAETGNMGRMPEKPVDLLVKVCRAHLIEKGAQPPADLRDRCNDALLAALMGGR